MPVEQGGLLGRSAPIALGLALALVGLPSAPAAAQTSPPSAKLAAIASAPRFVEGQGVQIQIVLTFPRACSEVEVMAELEITIRRSVFSFDVDDIMAMTLDGKPVSGKTLPLLLRAQGVRDRLVHVLGIVTADDDRVEGTEVFGVDVAVHGDPPSVICRVDQQEVPLAIEPQAVSLEVAVEDNDRAGPERPLADLAGRPRAPLLVAGPGELKLVAFLGRDEEGLGLFAQLLDGEREPIGPIQRFAQLDEPSQIRAAGAALPDGFVLVYRVSAPPEVAPSPAALILARTVTLGGKPGIQPPRLVALAPGGDVGSLAASSDGSGNVVVSWTEQGEARARLLDSEGLPRSPVFFLAKARAVAVASAPTGQFVAVWRHGERGVFARLFDEEAGPLGPPLEVSGDPFAGDPDVAIDALGNFVVVWEQGEVGDRDIWMQRYFADGERRGEALRANTTLLGDQRNPAVGMNVAGDFAVVWESRGSPSTASFEAFQHVLVGTAEIDQPFLLDLEEEEDEEGQSVVSRFFGDPGEEDPEEEPPATEEEIVAESGEGTDPGNPDVEVDDDGETTVVYEKEDEEGDPGGVFTNSPQPALAPEPCMPGATTLCLSDGRFAVSVSWRDHAGNRGEGQAVAFTSSTGYFWFFDAGNLELVVKVLSGCGTNDRFWFFAGGLTDVEVSILVEDSERGESKSYFNPRGTPFPPLQDTAAFDTCD